MAMEILCADSCDFWTKIGGVLCINVFSTVRGAVTGPCEKSGAEVLLRHLGSVRAQFRCHRANPVSDFLFADTHASGHARTCADKDENIVKETKRRKTIFVLTKEI